MINRAALGLNCSLCGAETHVSLHFIQDPLGSVGLLEERVSSVSGVNRLEMVVCLKSK